MSSFDGIQLKGLKIKKLNVNISKKNLQWYYEIKKLIFLSNAFISKIAIDVSFCLTFLFNNNHNKTQ